MPTALPAVSIGSLYLLKELGGEEGDIGIAMGTGTEVTKEAAVMILA